MSNLAQFKAVYCSGLFIPEPSEVSALSLLFEKIYLPNNFELVKELSKRYSITYPLTHEDLHSWSNMLKEIGKKDDPLRGLTTSQRDTVLNYFLCAALFGVKYSSLLSEIFETKMFSKNDIVTLENGNTTTAPTLTLAFEDYETFPRLLSEGYFPVIGSFRPSQNISKQIDLSSARALATLLAMKSVQMLIPRTKAVHPEIILEARHRLSNHLPSFWSSMLKLSTELRNRINQSTNKYQKDIFDESQELVDTIVRPSLIDLQEKMLKEKRDWFYKILSPIHH